MLAEEAELKPSKPSWMALSIEASSPRYAFLASSAEVTVFVPQAARRSRREMVFMRRLVSSRFPGGNAPPGPAFNAAPAVIEARRASEALARAAQEHSPGSAGRGRHHDRRTP